MADSGSKASKMIKSKKGLKRNRRTKFEEYLRMDMPSEVAAQEDLKLERKLAKKLKVKDGKLRGGNDDELNMIVEGFPSVLGTLKDGVSDERSVDVKPEKGKSMEKAMEDNVGDDGNTKVISQKRCRKRKSLRKKEEGDPDGKSANSDEKHDKDMTLEEAPTTVPTKELSVKYVSPHLRSCRANETEEQTQIRRRVRGLLNRLSESNVESITGEMATIYGSTSRNISSEIITEEVLASCSRGPRGNEQHAAVFAAFTAGLACLVGMDFSAKIMASFAKIFEEDYLNEDNLSLRNLTLLLSYLCIFGVCSSDLIYDFLITLSKRLTETDVSTILTVLQCCGMKIRGDDPSTMKNFIQSVQNRVNELKESSNNGPSNFNGKRMEFMLETICDIKNNKKRPKEDTVQHTRIKKWLQKLRVDDILLRGLKWSKLLDPNKKGQWWLSGDMAAKEDNVEEIANTIDKESLEAQRMLQLAAAQRMNTDARKAIFCIIMSAEDYIDAFEKLLRLDLPGKQDREIMRVIVECCLQEKAFNKYYTVLAAKFCEYEKNHKFTLQFCLWDHFKELETMPLRRSMHLAKFTAEMIASFNLSLAVLKTVEWNDPQLLTPKRMMYFRMLFEAIFEYSEKNTWNMFTRVAITPELETLREGIEFFVKEYVVKASKSLASKFKLAKKALNNAEGVLM